jgi:hypothetical protein
MSRGNTYRENNLISYAFTNLGITIWVYTLNLEDGGVRNPSNNVR